jgi:hypothetical protein
MRRKFFDAQESYPARSLWLPEMIRRLYAVESDASGRDATQSWQGFDRSNAHRHLVLMLSTAGADGRVGHSIRVGKLIWKGIEPPKDRHPIKGDRSN